MDNKKKQLMDIVGRPNVADDSQILESYARDESFVAAMKPWFVVRPKNTDEVQKVVAWANATVTPLIPVSSGPPHFYGDTVPSAPGAVIVDLSRMTKILRIDRRNRIAVVEPGVTYTQLQPELAKAGMRLTMPLLPRANKSVIASLLERQPTVIPRYNYNLPEPLRNCGVVWGSGAISYTGHAGNGPFDLNEQWKAGEMPIDPKGPNATDFMRLLTGAQGSMGIVAWASIKCEILPCVRKLFFVPAERFQDLMDFSYWMQRLRLGDEVLLVNNTLLATLLGRKALQIDAFRDKLPPWVMIIGVAGRAIMPEEKMNVVVQDMTDLVQKHGLRLLPSLPGVATSEVLDILLSPAAEPDWKLKYKGGGGNIFFHSTLENIPRYIETMQAAARAFKYPENQIGIYVQPQHHGVAYHCEFHLAYDPGDAKGAARIRDLYARASEELIGQRAYFSRPYGLWANLVCNRDAQGMMALRKVKQIFDPNNVMNPGKLCF